MSGKYARPKSHRPFLPVVAGLGILMLGVLIVGTASAEPVEVGPVAGESECAEASVTVTWDGATVTKVVVGFEDSGDPEDPATRNHAEVTVFADDTSVFWQDVTTFESTGLVTPDEDGDRVQVAFGEGQAVCAILVEAPETKPEPEPDSTIVGCDGPPGGPESIRATFTVEDELITSVLVESGYGPDVTVPGGIVVVGYDGEGYEESFHEITGSVEVGDLSYPRVVVQYAEARYGLVDSADPQPCETPDPDETPAPLPTSVPAGAAVRIDTAPQEPPGGFAEEG